MNIFVTGATGFIGTHLIKALALQGLHCTCLVRPNSNVHELLKFKNIKLVYGDITDKTSLEKNVRNVQVIYHLAGQLGEYGVPDNEFFSVNVDGTRNLLEAADRAGSVHFIFCSTPGVQGKGFANATEDLPYNPPHIYELTKALAEKLLLSFGQTRKGPFVTIIRPDFVYGPGDFRRVPLYKAIKNRKFFLIGKGKAFLHPTFVEDVVKGLCLLPNNPVTFGQIYNMAGPRSATVKEFVQTISETLKVPLPRLSIPVSIARIIAILFKVYSKVTGNAPLLTLSQIDFLTQHHGSDISKAMNRLGYMPEIALEEGMRQTIDWCWKEELL